MLEFAGVRSMQSEQQVKAKEVLYTNFEDSLGVTDVTL